MDNSVIESLVGNSVFAAMLAFVMRWLLRDWIRELRGIKNADYILSWNVVSLQKQLLQHDATVSGINPSMGQSEEERCKRAYEKYLQLEQILTEQSQMLQRSLPKARTNGD